MTNQSDEFDQNTCSPVTKGALHATAYHRIKRGLACCSGDGGRSEPLIESLQNYRDLDPDVVLWNASRGPRSFVETTEAQWKEDIDTAIAKLRE